MAPVALNIVCFRYMPSRIELNGSLQAGSDAWDCHALDRLNADIVADVQEAGIAAPSTTIVNGMLCIRAAIVNHQTNEADVAMLVNAVLEAGRARVALR